MAMINENNKIKVREFSFSKQHVRGTRHIFGRYWQDKDQATGELPYNADEAAEAAADLEGQTSLAYHLFGLVLALYPDWPVLSFREAWSRAVMILQAAASGSCSVSSE